MANDASGDTVSVPEVRVSWFRAGGERLVNGNTVFVRPTASALPTVDVLRGANRYPSSRARRPAPCWNRGPANTAALPVLQDKKAAAMTVNPPPPPPPAAQPPESQRPFLTLEALVILLIVGLAATAAVVWPAAAVGITVGAAVLAVLIVATQPRR